MLTVRLKYFVFLLDFFGFLQEMFWKGCRKLKYALPDTVATLQLNRFRFLDFFLKYFGFLPEHFTISTLDFLLDFFRFLPELFLERLEKCIICIAGYGCNSPTQ